MKKTSSKLGLHKEYCHAEALTIVRAKGKGEKLIVARVDGENRPCYSAPALYAPCWPRKQGLRVLNSQFK